jgi:hypothetical protein
VVKIKRKSPEHPPQFQGVLRLAEGSKRLILSTSVRNSVLTTFVYNSSYASASTKMTSAKDDLSLDVDLVEYVTS